MSINGDMSFSNFSHTQQSRPIPIPGTTPIQNDWEVCPWVERVTMLRDEMFCFPSEPPHSDFNHSGNVFTPINPSTSQEQQSWLEQFHLEEFHDVRRDTNYTENTEDGRRTAGSGYSGTCPEDALEVALAITMQSLTLSVDRVREVAIPSSSKPNSPAEGFIFSSYSTSSIGSNSSPEASYISRIDPVTSSSDKWAWGIAIPVQSGSVDTCKLPHNPSAIHGFNKGK